MSTTATATVIESLPAVTAHAAHSSSSSCPNCGLSLSHSESAEDAQQRVFELEAQLKSLSSKAAVAADKLADYEDEIRFLRSQNQHSSTPLEGPIPSTLASPPPEHIPPLAPPQIPAQQTRLSSLSSLLSGRRASPSNSLPPTPGLPPAQGLHSNHSSSSLSTSQLQQIQNPSELQNLLTNEKRLRQQAESRLSTAQSELEELTAQLFSQANEMVAQERKARARLEERVEVLERRDGEKRRRLERLERAVERVDRVRGIVG